MKRIKLAGGKFTKVDDADYDWLRGFKWYLSTGGYACTTLPRPVKKNKPMHRFLLPNVAGKMADHINRDKLDNRRCNLRLVTKSENNRNRRSKGESGVLGVCLSPGGTTWVASASVNDWTYYIGSFKTIDEAAKARTDFLEKVFKDPSILDRRRGQPLYRNNTSGFPGVHKNRDGRWIARLSVGGGKRLHLGCYSSAREAHEAVKAYGK